MSLGRISPSICKGRLRMMFLRASFWGASWMSRWGMASRIALREAETLSEWWDERVEEGVPHGLNGVWVYDFFVRVSFRIVVSTVVNELHLLEDGWLYEGVTWDGAEGDMTPKRRQMRDGPCLIHQPPGAASLSRSLPSYDRVWAGSQSRHYLGKKDPQNELGREVYNAEEKSVNVDVRAFASSSTGEDWTQPIVWKYVKGK